MKNPTYNDLNLKNWRDYPDILTDSLWLFPQRATGHGDAEVVGHVGRLHASASAGPRGDERANRDPFEDGRAGERAVG